MRTTQFDVRLSFNELEVRELANLAFEAGMPVHDWIRRQLFERSKPQSEQPATAAQPEQPITTTTTTAVQPEQPAAPPPPPPPPHTPEPVGPSAAAPPWTAPAPGPAAAPPWTAPAPGPAAPPEPAAPPGPAAAPPRTAPPGPAAAPAEEVFITPAPAPSSPQPLLPSPVVVRRRKRKADISGVPLGFDTIVTLGERLVANRRRLIEELHTDRGYSYVQAMSRWYLQNGLAEVSSPVRTALAKIGNNASEIREWYGHRLEGAIPDDISPTTLLRMWELSQEGEEYEDEDEGEDGGEAGGEEQQERPSERAAAPDETIIIRHGRMERASLSEYLSTGNGGSAPPVESEQSEQQPVRARFSHFGEVDLGNLDQYDARVLRRFTEKINYIGASENVSDDKIAASIRKIRGNETGDNPPTAMALVRLGVIAGASGQYRLRREYINRFEDVKRWILMSRTVSPEPARVAK